MKKVVNSICQVLIDIYPDTIQYIQKIPEGFNRPSLYVKFIDVNRERMNYDTYKDDFMFKIVYFPNRDEFNIADKLDLMDEIERIRGAFHRGYLSIVDTDRVAKVSNINAQSVEGNIHVTLEISLTDSYEIIEDYELLQEVNYNEEVK